MNQNLCRINARKMDGQIYRTWQAKLISETRDYWLFAGVFDKEVNHSDLGIIRRNTISYEYYWKSRWYNVFRFHEPDGKFRNFYCNINQPPDFSKGILNYIDLDIDILVYQDMSYRILDLDEFESNAISFNYSPHIIQKVNETKLELLNLIKNWRFPFNFLQ